MVERKKNIVGGSVEQLPNTCQVENKTIGDLAVVITITITMMHSPRVNLLRFKRLEVNGGKLSKTKQFATLETKFSSCCCEGVTSSSLLFF